MFITGTVRPPTSEILMILDNNDNDDDDGDDDGGGDDDDNYCRSIIVCTPASDNMLGWVGSRRDLIVSQIFPVKRARKISPT